MTLRHRSAAVAAVTRSATSSPQELLLPRGAHPVPTHTRLNTRRVPVAVYVAVLLLLPALVVGGFVRAGWWATTGKTANAQTADARPDLRIGDGASVVGAPAAPADVKGSMTVQQVVDAFPPVSAVQVLTQLGAPLDTPTSTQLKTLVEAGNGIDIPGLRTWLEQQLPE